HPQFGLGQDLLRLAHVRHPFLEELHGLFQGDVVGFHARQDPLEAPQATLEPGVLTIFGPCRLFDTAHASSSGSSARGTARTQPSLTRTTNSSSTTKSRVVLSTRPSSVRTTAYPRANVASGESASRRPAAAESSFFRAP